MWQLFWEVNNKNYNVLTCLTQVLKNFVYQPTTLKNAVLVWVHVQINLLLSKTSFEMASFQVISSSNDFGHRLDQLHGDNFDLQPSHDHQTDQQNNDLFFIHKTRILQTSLLWGENWSSRQKVKSGFYMQTLQSYLISLLQRIFIPANKGH